ERTDKAVVAMEGKTVVRRHGTGIGGDARLQRRTRRPAANNQRRQQRCAFLRRKIRPMLLEPLGLRRAETVEGLYVLGQSPERQQRAVVGQLARVDRQARRRAARVPRIAEDEPSRPQTGRRLEADDIRLGDPIAKTEMLRVVAQPTSDVVVGLE